MSKRSRGCDGGGCGAPSCGSCWVQPGDAYYFDPRFAELRAPIDRYGGATSASLPPLQQVPDNKRQRLEAEPTTAAPLSFKNMVDELDDATVRAVLINLATIRGSPSAQDAIQLAYHQIAQAPPINFDHHSKEAWHVLNSSHYTRLSSSKQYDASGDALGEINECIREINTQTKANSPLGTKQSALETMRKILKTMLLGEDTLGHEVRKELQWDAEIPNAMKRILESMSAEDRIRVGSAADAKGSLAEKIQWVRDEADAYCLEGLSGLGRVLELMGADVDETSED